MEKANIKLNITGEGKWLLNFSNFRRIQWIIHLKTLDLLKMTVTCVIITSNERQGCIKEARILTISHKHTVEYDARTHPF